MLQEAIQRRALEVLRERFGFERFRAGQEEIVSAVLHGRDVLAVMPTGGGKSLGYVLPALLTEAPVLVVSPLIALMKDQVDQLVARGIAAGHVNSTVAASEQHRRIEAFRAGRLRLLFVAPERFRSDRFRAALAGFRPALFAVDEAHCISQWGHDFRPDYLRLKEAAAELGRPPILALTATATPEVREHIAANLGLERPAIIVKGFERPNLEFAVVRCASKTEKIERAVAEARRGSRGIVYAATRKNVEELATALVRFGLQVGAYHAGLVDDRRREVQEQFASGALPIVVATNAFGMGIDRPDLRFVVHFDVPGSVEAYAQEAGRAGRDQQPSRCVLLYQAADARLQRFFIETTYPDPELVRGVLDLLARRRDAVLLEDSLAGLLPGEPHPRGVESALRILGEQGAVLRGFDREGGMRAVRFQEAKEIDLSASREQAAREYRRLQRMLDYAEGGACPRAYLVNYFTGDGAAEDCGSCERCAARLSRRAPTEGERAALARLLGVVRELDGRFGRKKLLGILAGSKARELLDLRLDRSPHYGALAGLGSGQLDALFSECIALGLLAVEGGEYPLIALTPRGRSVLDGHASVDLGCFDRPARPAPTPAPATAGRAREAAPVAAADAALVDRLKQWRREQAQREGMPAYVIFHDKTLQDIAAARPRDAAALRAVKGVGPSKFERYGAALLAIVGS